ncbi:iron-containing alcohol dehydrogenase [Candidatus Bipolaricaulota bacterium]|nr:iron-containing alcohol dehydrogenase [Candidatus Bipolaricaulota bacterium]
MKTQSSRLNFKLPTRIDFGTGRIGVLPEELEQNGFKRVAFVITPGRYRSGMLDASISSLKESEIEFAIFDGVGENPDVDTVRHCVHFLKAHRPDVVIGVGGGSPLDTSKAAAICYANGVEDVLELINSTKIQNKTVPTIMVPTTAGTGTELNFWAVITDKKTKEKLSLGDPRMAPHMAIVDPELTLTLPRRITLWTGLDALTHALEAYVSTRANRLSDLLALEAIKLILENLDRVVDHGDNLEAREHMALASLLAGAAMQHVGLGLIHAMSHQVSGFYDTPHGLTNAKLLAPVFTFNLPEIPQEKRANLDSLSEMPFQNVLTEIDRGYGLADEVITIRKSDLALMSKRARENVNAKTNPRKASMEEVRALFRQAFIVE